MGLYPDSMELLIEEYRKLPGIGRKTAQRLAMYTIESGKEGINKKIEVLLNVRDNVRRCPKCNNLTDQKICSICSDDSRDGKTICVVEDISNLIAIEKSNSYKGKYYVLNGLISPSKGLGPEEVGIDKFLDTLNDDVKEVILAISQTVDGETTMLLITELLKNKNIKVSRIASGIPIGGNLEYFDDITLAKAIEDRRLMDHDAIWCFTIIYVCGRILSGIEFNKYITI